MIFVVSFHKIKEDTKGEKEFDDKVIAWVLVAFAKFEGPTNQPTNLFTAKRTWNGIGQHTVEVLSYLRNPNLIVVVSDKSCVITCGRIENVIVAVNSNQGLVNRLGVSNIWSDGRECRNGGGEGSQEESGVEFHFK